MAEGDDGAGGGDDGMGNDDGAMTGDDDANRFECLPILTVTTSG